MPVPDLDLEAVIEDSVSDAALPAEPVEAPADDLDTPVEPVQAEASPEAHLPDPVVPEAPEPEEQATSSKKPALSKEDFDQKFGLTQFAPSGRENRIPYSRVKKIAQKAVRDARKEWEGEFSPKQTEWETKAKDYESKLDRYTKFEQIMVNDQDKFLTMLSSVPAYQGFFKAVEEAFQFQQQYKDKVGTSPTAPSKEVVPGSDMPQPNQRLSDGSMVYDLEGLQAVLDWKAKQVEERITKQIENRYKPIESEWEAQRRVNELVPQVQAQIADARTWPMFNEHEEEIVKALSADKRLSLEGAYRKVVMPKMVADRNKVREDVLREVKQAPRATSAPVQSSKPAPSSEPKSLEDIIAEQIKGMKS